MTHKAPLYKTLEASSDLGLMSVGEVLPVPDKFHFANPKAFFLPVSDDDSPGSMFLGSYALIDPDSDFINGEVYAVHIEGANAILRRITRTPHSVIVSTANGDVIYKEEDIVIRGRMIWYMGPLD